MTAEELTKRFPGAWIGEDAVIRKGVVIKETAWIGEDVVIEEAAWIGKGSVIKEAAWIEKAAVIGEGAVIKEGAVIEGGAVIGEGRKNVSHNIVINGIGGTRNITGYVCDDGVIVNIGGQNNYKGHPLDKMRVEIAKKYPLEHEYFDALNLVEKFLKKKIEGEYKEEP